MARCGGVGGCMFGAAVLACALFSAACAQTVAVAYAEPAAFAQQGELTQFGAGEAEEFSPVSIRAELRDRGFDPLSGDVSVQLQDRFIAYQFAVDGGLNFVEDPSLRRSAQNLDAAVRATGATAFVQFRTSTPGASVRYQSIAETRVSTAPGLTNQASDVVPIGFYYVWAERNGRETSKREMHQVLRERLTIDIAESVP